MWDLKIDTRRLVDGFSTSVPWDRPNILWNKADDWWNDNYVTDSNTAAFLSATGIIDPNKQNYVNNLVIALKNQGLWNKMKAIYPFVSEQRNLLNNTEDFSTSSWTKSGAVVTANDILAPNGTLTADKVVFSGANKEIYQGISGADNYCVSVYVKGTAGETINFADGVGVVNTLFTLNGSWQRINFNTTASNYQCDINTYFGATARIIWVWGGQIELGSTLTDYQTTINAQEQFAAAYKYNLKDPQDTDAAFRLKIFGTWTFSPTGAKPNGTNAYMDTSFVPSLNSSLNNAHLSYYSRTSVVGTQVDMGSIGSVSNAFYLIMNLNNVAPSGINSSETNRTSAMSPTLGLLIGSRVSSTEEKYYTNNVSQILTKNSNSMNSLNVYLGCFNQGGIANLFSTKQCAFSSIGDGLTDAEALAFYTIVQQFQTSMARQV